VKGFFDGKFLIASVVTTQAIDTNFVLLSKRHCSIVFSLVEIKNATIMYFLSNESSAGVGLSSL